MRERRKLGATQSHFRNNGKCTSRTIPPRRINTTIPDLSGFRLIRLTWWATGQPSRLAIDKLDGGLAVFEDKTCLVLQVEQEAHHDQAFAG